MYVGDGRALGWGKQTGMLLVQPVSGALTRGRVGVEGARNNVQKVTNLARQVHVWKINNEFEF